MWLAYVQDEEHVPLTPLIGNVLFEKEIRRAIRWLLSTIRLIKFTSETRELLILTTSMLSNYSTDISAEDVKLFLWCRRTTLKLLFSQRENSEKKAISKLFFCLAGSAQQACWQQSTHLAESLIPLYLKLTFEVLTWHSSFRQRSLRSDENIIHSFLGYLLRSHTH